MTQRNDTSVYTTTIFFGMFGIIISEALFAGQTELFGILLGSGIILVSLIAKMIINHNVIMESDAPGAHLYQGLMTLTHLPSFLTARRKDYTFQK